MGHDTQCHESPPCVSMALVTTFTAAPQQSAPATSKQRSHATVNIVTSTGYFWIVNVSPLYRIFVCSRHSLSPDWRGVVHCTLCTAACTKTFLFPAQSIEMIEQIIVVMISMVVGQEGVNLFIVFYPSLLWQLIHIVVSVRCMRWEMMRNIVARIVCC